MSHEIRTPMNAIMGFTDLLGEQLKEPRLLGYVRTIQSAGKTLLGLINDILDLSKIEAGKMTLLSRPTNLADLFNEIGSIFTMNLRQKNLSLVIDVDANLPQSVLIDSTRLRQILFNLVGNAVKFTEHGHVTLSLQMLEVDEHHSKVDLEIVVADTGLGIAPDQIERIFNLFEQQDGQDSRKYGGTGLGLAITRRLVEMMDGTIHVQSTFGEGSRFIVKFYGVDIASVHAEPIERSSEATEQCIHFEPARILVVDDIKDNRDLLREYFANSAVVTDEATDGAQAVAMSAAHPYDLIIMDIRMPVMDGYEAAKQIKASCDVPIIALTASVMQHERDRLDVKSFDGYLRKPVRYRELFLEVSKFLKHSIQTPHIPVEPVSALSDEARMHQEEIAQRLTNELHELHQRCKSSRSLPQIRSLVEALNQLGATYKIASIEHYALRFQEALEAFDIATIQHLLEGYEPLVKEFLSACSSELR